MGPSVHLTALELDEGYCAHLRGTLPVTVDVVHGDASDMPFPPAHFSSVLSFTMLHHLPSSELQDRLFSEVARVLAPGGVFAGTDSLGVGPIFRLIHVGDTLVRVPPESLPERLRAAGLSEPSVETAGRSFRFRAQKAAQTVADAA